MPSSPNYKRDYKQERKTAIARGETGVGSNSKDAIRHRARRKMIKEHGEAALRGKDVDHKKALKDGGSNNIGNLSISSPSKNRSKGGKAGNRAGKAKGGRIGDKKKDK